LNVWRGSVQLADIRWCPQVVVVRENPLRELSKTETVFGLCLSRPAQFIDRLSHQPLQTAVNLPRPMFKFPESGSPTFFWKKSVIQHFFQLASNQITRQKSWGTDRRFVTRNGQSIFCPDGRLR
jgi:hypothetical protein